VRQRQLPLSMREAWRACGIDVPDADGPVEMDFGHVPIELMLLQPSPLGTFIVRISGLTSAEAGKLLVQAAAAGLEGEDWTANIQWLCEQCSESRCEHHDHEAPTDSTLRALAFGAPVGTGLAQCHRAAGGRGAFRVDSTLDCALPPLPVH
jgi:hypothetical protein